MNEHSIYEDIAKRSGGDIYIGVVGPVRSGKSTFIKRFMETTVLPNIKEGYEKDKARDELPQSAKGTMIMTTEPKFIPEKAVEVMINNAKMNIRMIDSVGYMIDGASGSFENGEERLVHTPWNDEEIPFSKAAEIGTKKVIDEHSTIGIIVSTDGTIGDIERENYVKAEERVVKELKEIGKPFVIVLNTLDPSNEESIKLAYSLEEKYNSPVALVNCLELNNEDINNILEMVLLEFPSKELKIKYPLWLDAIDKNSIYVQSIKKSIIECAENIDKIGEIQSAFEKLSENENIESVSLLESNLGNGQTTVEIRLPKALYYKILSENTNMSIENEKDIMEIIKEYSAKKDSYQKIESAMSEAEEKGYGIVMPTISELKLEEPDVIKQAGGYGVKLKASAPSYHIVKAKIESEINPVVGTEQQTEDMVKYLLDEYEENPNKLWDSNMFGKSLYELVNDGLQSKLNNMPEESRVKISQTLERIINEGSSGLVCILL